MGGAIYRNGYKYGDGIGVVQNPVLAIKSGDELYKPENGVVELPDFNEAIEDNVITNTASAAVITLSDTADSNPLALTVYGKSEVVDGAITSAGEGWATVDLGTLDYTDDPSIGQYGRFYTSSLANVIQKVNSSLLCSRFNQAISLIDVTGHESGYMYLSELGNISFSRNGYETDVAFKTAMSGVLLCYELADPTQGNCIAVKTDNGTGINGTMAAFETGVPLRGIPNTEIKDSMYWDGSSGEVTKNCNVLNMGGLTWGKADNGRMYTSPITEIKRPADRNTLPNIVNPIYMPDTDYNVGNLTTDKTIAIGNDYRIYVYDTDYTDATDFKTAMSGVKLVYELSTPTTKPLTSAEVNAFKQLRTYDPNTTVSNNADSVMDIKYYKNSTNGNAVKDIDKAVDEVNERVPKKIEPSCTTTKLDNTTGWFIDMTFSGLTSFDGNYIWTDGENIYYSNGTNQYVFDKASTTWSSKTWSGLTDFDGRYVWTDGTDIYYSKSSEQYVLNKSTSTWSAKTWTGLTSFYGGDIWTDGENIYRSNGSSQYVLDKSTSTWSAKTWAGLTNFYSAPIWSDGENIYYSSGTSQYILNKETSTWSTKTWGGTNINGSSVWTDGNDIYYSYSTNDRYVLDRSTDTWYAKKWNGVPTNFNGLYVWTDGDNIYYSSDTTHKKLIPKPKIKSTRLH